MEDETKDKTESVRTNINVRISDREREMIKKLARYLYLRELIPENNMSNAIRYCIYYTYNGIRKIIEKERYGGV